MATIVLTPQDFQRLDTFAIELARTDGLNCPVAIGVGQAGYLETRHLTRTLSREYAMPLVSVYRRTGWRIVHLRHGAVGKEAADHLELRLKALGWGDFEFKRLPWFDR